MLVVVAAVGVLPGAQTSLQWTAAVTTAWMPLITFVALWLSWRPANRTQVAAATVAVLATAAGMVAAASLLLADGAVSIERSFPVVAAPLVVLFLTFLQISLVCEKAPFDRWGWRGGVAALAVSAGAAAFVGTALLDWSSVPADARPPGLRRVDGVVDGADVLTWLTVLAAWQVVVVVVADGYPGRLARRRATRIAINNVVTVGATCATYAVASVSGFPGPWLAAAGGCVVAGGRLPFSLTVDGVDTRGALPRRCLVAAVASGAVFAVLFALASSSAFDEQPRGLWIAVTALNLVSGGITWAASLLFSRAGGTTS